MTVAVAAAVAVTMVLAVSSAEVATVMAAAVTAVTMIKSEVVTVTTVEAEVVTATMVVATVMALTMVVPAMVVVVVVTMVFAVAVAAAGGGDIPRMARSRGHSVRGRVQIRIALRYNEHDVPSVDCCFVLVERREGGEQVATALADASRLNATHPQMVLEAGVLPAVVLAPPHLLDIATERRT